MALAQRLRSEGAEAFVWPPVVERLFPGLRSLPRVHRLPFLVTNVRSCGVGVAVIVDERCLYEGLTDLLRAQGVEVFAPTLEASAIEYSKLVTKELFGQLGIPTPPWRQVTSFAAAERVFDELGPVDLKRSPSMSSRDVEPVGDHRELFGAWKRINEGERARILAEQAVDGDDIAVMCLVGDRGVVVLAPIQYFPRRSLQPSSALTSGMGARTPAPGCPPQLAADVVERVVLPLLDCMRAVDLHYRGALTVRLRVTGQRWAAREVACHWGDPETQAVLAAHDLRLLDTIGAGAGAGPGRGDPVERDTRTTVCEASRSAVSVVLARAEYPHAHRYTPLTYPPDVLNDLDAAYHPYDASRGEDRSISSTSGRCCSLTATGDSIAEACATVRRDADHAAALYPQLEYNPAVCQPPGGAR